MQSGRGKVRHGRSRSVAATLSGSPESRAALSALDDVVNSEHATPKSSGAVPSPAGTPAPPRRRQGHVHSSRVEELLRKYLGDDAPGATAAARSPSRVLTKSASVPVTVAETVDILPGEGVALHYLAMAQARKNGLKSIMQVKSEQDAAIKELQSAPRTFIAKPVPLAVAERQGGQPQRPAPAAPAVVVAEPAVPFMALPVPLFTAEPRYAMLVADAQLRRYSAQQAADAEAPAPALKRPSTARPRSPGMQALAQSAADKELLAVPEIMELEASDF